MAPPWSTRRRFLSTTLAAGAGLTLPTIFVRRASAEERVLRIVQWKHFVPAYDAYFAELARSFGEKHGCRVEVDNINVADLPTAVAADVARGGGHDIFHLVGSGAWLHESALVDVTEVAQRLGGDLGGWIPAASALAEVQGRWLCIPHWYNAYPWIVNQRHLDGVGERYTEETTWEDVRRIGAKLKNAGHPIGLPFSQCNDSNNNLDPLLLSHEAYFFDPAGNVRLAKREITETLKLGAAIFEEAMTSEVLSWDDTSNNRFLISGRGSMICNPISAYRTAAKERPDVYQDLAVVPPPRGVHGIRVGGADSMSYGVFRFSKVQDLAKEFLYAMVADSAKGMAASSGFNLPFLRAFARKPMPVLGAEPKLQFLQDSAEWVRLVGYPGPVTKIATGMHAKFIVPKMFAEVATGRPPRAAMDDAERKLRAS